MSLSKTKKNKFLIVIFASLIFFASLPIAFAGTEGTALAPTGEDCFPNDPAQDMKCPFDKKLGTEGLVIKWKAVGTLPKDYFCYLSCRRADGTSCAYYTYIKNNRQILTNDLTGSRKIYPQDAGIIEASELKEGNSYQVLCLANKDQSEIGKNPNLSNLVLAKGKKIEIINTPGNCENPFDEIVYNLDRGVKAVITEANFQDWSKVQSLDNLVSSKKLGSGDKLDIEAEMENTQICYENNLSNQTIKRDFIAEYGQVFESLNSLLKRYQPVSLGLYYNDPTNNRLKGHEILALRIESISNDKFKLYFLDSNKSGPSNFECQKKIDPEFPADGLWANCSYLDQNQKKIEVVLGINRSEILAVPCAGVVREKPTEWLMSNYPDITNFNSTQTGFGVCYGWASFVKKVGCYGDFVGKDFHPNDGRVIGKDCDINHYPIGKKKASSLNSSSWLANFWTAFSTFAF